MMVEGQGHGHDAVDVAGWLASGRAFASGGPVEVIGTHAALIVLHGDRAWKIKRPVSLGYLDFSTAEKRKLALDAELTLNRRAAPDVYIAVHAITLSKAGTLALEGEGEIVDWVLEMRRFPAGALLGEMIAAGAVTDDTMRALADAILALHAGAAVATGQGAARLRRVIDGNAAAMARYPDILPPDRATALTVQLIAQTTHHSGLLDMRCLAGRVRQGHGDLHLANIVLLEGRPVLFDCLEFDPELATSDVLYDLGFLLMDLCAKGRHHEANLVFNRYLDCSAQDEAGVALIGLFMAVRASIRAHVLAAQSSLDPSSPTARMRALRYLELAETLSRGQAARLVAVGGLSGSGKSTLARSLGGAIGAAPGARILRSDVLRKRLAGVAPEVHLSPAHYTPEESARVYAEMARLAAQALGIGQSVLADAVFSRAQERRDIAAVARDAGVPFDGLWLEVGTQERLERVAARPPDASDADPAVVRAQAATGQAPPLDWVTLNASGAFDELRAAARRSLDLSPAVPRDDAMPG
ncbi:MAG: AAA family ATPase [Sphingomonadales bacterium]|nr:AAA family ATPase [Sphingomonadales bacterium]MDE2170926.1 AAA family ATPase [Sphingomonadales bacterium]